VKTGTTEGPPKAENRGGGEWQEKSQSKRTDKTRRKKKGRRIRLRWRVGWGKWRKVL